MEKIKANILYSLTSPPSTENIAVYEIMWENIVQPERPQMTTRRMRIACRIPKATDTHSEYVIPFFPFPLQQWLHDRASLLRYSTLSVLFILVIRLVDGPNYF